MISVENLSFVYEGAERRALDGGPLRIPRGAFAGVTGASGSGKSTLLRAIAGIVPHYLRGRFFGAVKVGGLDTLENSPADRAARRFCRARTSKARWSARRWRRSCSSGWKISPCPVRR